MEDDYTDLLNVYLNNEEQKLLFGSRWTGESILPENDNNTATGGDKTNDVQALFNGEINPEVDNSDDDTSSESESESWSPREAKNISDEEIKNLRVKELNKRLRKVPFDEAAKIRRRRRNLKNRGYALTCRLRKQQEHEDLIIENTLLKKYLEDGKLKLLKVFNEKEAYKRKCVQAQKSLSAYKQITGTSEVPPCR